MIDVRGVTKSYDDTKVVDNVCLQIERGGLTAIIGPNGAGKSTLLSMISRLIPMDSGTVIVDELDVSTTKSEKLARRLSILKQDNYITSRLSVQDLVTFGRFPYTKGRTTSEDLDHVENALRYTELIPFRDRFLDQLSGGQRQRAFVAMVLCQDTDYILLDEPMNSMDMKHAVSMMKMLRRIATDHGKTIVFVIHDINFASCYADSIVAMKDGHIAFHAPPAEIMCPEVLHAVFEVDVRVHLIDGQRIAVYYD